MEKYLQIAKNIHKHLFTVENFRKGKWTWTQTKYIWEDQGPNIRNIKRLCRDVWAYAKRLQFMDEHDDDWIEDMPNLEYFYPTEYQEEEEGEEEEGEVQPEVQPQPNDWDPDVGYESDEAYDFSDDDEPLCNEEFDWVQSPIDVFEDIEN